MITGNSNRISIAFTEHISDNLTEIESRRAHTQTRETKRRVSFTGCRSLVVGCRLQVAGCRLQVAGRRSQVAGCSSEFEVRANAKVILRKKLSLQSVKY